MFALEIPNVVSLFSAFYIISRFFSESDENVGLSKFKRSCLCDPVDLFFYGKLRISASNESFFVRFCVLRVSYQFLRGSVRIFLFTKHKIY